MMVTVCIPIYKPDYKFLDQALRSVADQTIDPSKIYVMLLLDGEPSSKIKDLAASIFKDRIFWQVVELEHQGLARTLLHGLKYCNTKYFARLDSDDIMDETRLQKQIDLLETKPNLTLCGSNSVFIDKNDSIIPKRPLQLFARRDFFIRLKMSLLSNAILHPSVTGVTEALRRENCYEHGIPFEDYKSWASMSRKANMANIDEPLIKYRVHSGQSSRKRGLRYRDKTRIRLTSCMNLIFKYPFMLCFLPLFVVICITPTRDMVAIASRLRRQCNVREEGFV